MSRTLSALLLLALAWPAWADHVKLEIPAEVKATPGDWAVVVPDTNCKAVLYVGLDGLKPFPSSELKDPRRLVFLAPASGRFRFVAVGTLDDELVRRDFVVVAGDTPPGPPVPPTPPPDVDPLVSGFQAHYDADQSPGKQMGVVRLAYVYAAAVNDLARNPVVTTNADAAAKAKAAQELAIPGDTLKSLKGRIAAELGDQLPAGPIDRDKAAALFARISRCLDQIDVSPQAARRGGKKK